MNAAMPLMAKAAAVIGGDDEVGKPARGDPVISTLGRQDRTVLALNPFRCPHVQRLGNEVHHTSSVELSLLGERDAEVARHPPKRHCSSSTNARVSGQNFVAMLTVDYCISDAPLSTSGPLTGGSGLNRVR
jgi:hypothetical protein